MISATARRTVKVQDVTMSVPGAVASLVHRGSLDVGQVEAAIGFQHNWQTMHAPGLRSPDLSRVSGRTSGFADPLTEAYAKACYEMEQAKKVLGTDREYGFNLVVQAVVEGKTLAMLGRDQTERRVASHMLRMNLNTLALLWGYKAKR